MAMNMTGEYCVPVDQETVWRALNDTAVLAASIPGCESLEEVAPQQYKAVATVKIGPIKAKFRGEVTLSDFVPPESYRIAGRGDGGGAGFAEGAAVVRLQRVDDTQTLLTYELESQVSGKLAQIGQRLINGAVKKLADQFFSEFCRQIAPETARSDI